MIAVNRSALCIACSRDGGSDAAWLIMVRKDSVSRVETMGLIRCLVIIIMEAGYVILISV